MADNKQTETKVDPKRIVEVIEVDHLEDVVGGIELGGGGGNPNRRMSTESAE